MTISYPFQFWSYTNQALYSYTTEEHDDHILFKVELPGVEKEDLSLSHDPSRGVIEIRVKDKELGFIKLVRMIDADNIEADLKLGILELKTPLKHIKKSIQIK